MKTNPVTGSVPVRSQARVLTAAIQPHPIPPTPHHAERPRPNSRQIASAGSSARVRQLHHQAAKPSAQPPETTHDRTLRTTSGHHNRSQAVYPAYPARETFVQRVNYWSTPPFPALSSSTTAILATLLQVPIPY
jgi:hypothetical protein